jgi:hypothetical protein
MIPLTEKTKEMTKNMKIVSIVGYVVKCHVAGTVD